MKAIVQVTVEVVVDVDEDSEKPMKVLANRALRDARQLVADAVSHSPGSALFTVVGGSGLLISFTPEPTSG